MATWHCSADRTSLVSAIGSASAGDTILMDQSPQTATWTSTLAITKNVSIVGQGIGNTVITSGTTGWLVTYTPVNNANLFRLSGITFNLNNHDGFFFNNNKMYPPAYQVRFDHNRVYGGSTAGRNIIYNQGCRGVIDNNAFENLVSTSICAGWGDDNYGLWNWQNYPELVYGAANDNMYVEDNTMSFGAVGEECFDSERGGRYVYRYNTITVAGQSWPIFDLHNGSPNSPTNLYSVMGGEVYANLITLTGVEQLIQWRGGRATVHHNAVTASSHGDSAVQLAGGSPQSPYLPEQLPNTGYFFLNRQGLAGSLLSMQKGSSYAEHEPCMIENTDWWKDAASFNGTVGIGYGTSLPDCSSYNVGVGYWVTSQSTTTLSGLVGAAPGSRNASSYLQGVLYRVIAGTPKTWEAVVTPYTYPHPLRGEGGAPPSANTVLSLR